MSASLTCNVPFETKDDDGGDSTIATQQSPQGR
jgi:hypothetical protein